MRVDVRGIAAATLERLPTALDEPFLRETWAGSHGRLGLHADLHGISSAATLGERTVSAQAGVSGHILLPSGEAVGTVQRRVNLMENGRLNVYHAYLELDRDVQRTGFAGSFNTQAYEAYARAGVDDVTVTAALDAGGYVWARTGFELAPGTNGGGKKAEAVYRAQQIRQLVTDAHSYGMISKQEFKDLSKRLIGDDGVVKKKTLTSIQDLAAMDGIGEKVLKGQAWHGLRTTGAQQPWWQLSRVAVPSSVADAASGAAHLRPADAVPDAVAHVRRTIASQLPDAVEPAALSRRLERATAGDRLQLVGVGDAKAAITLLGEPHIDTTVPLQILDASGAQVGSVQVGMTVNSTGRLAATREMHVPTGTDTRQLRSAMRDALRGVGAEQLTVTLPRPKSSQWWNPAPTRTYALT